MEGWEERWLATKSGSALLAKTKWSLRVGADSLLCTEGMFKKWLASTDELFTEYASKMPGGPLRTSPSFFERNLQVWRQLWRVTEVSSILLILVGTSSWSFPSLLPLCD